MGCGRHRRPCGHRLHRPGAVADAGVDRGDVRCRCAGGGDQHGSGPGRLLPGDPRRWPRRLPHAGARPGVGERGDGARAPRLRPRRPVAQPRRRVRRLLPRSHQPGGRDRGRGPGSGRPALGARRLHRGYRSGEAALAAGRGQATRRRGLRPRRALPASGGEHAGDGGGGGTPRRGGARRRRRARGRRVRHRRPLRARGRRRPTGRRAPRGLRPPDHLVPLPVGDRRRRLRRRPSSGGPREQPGPDGRRCAARGARHATGVVHRRAERRLIGPFGAFGVGPDIDVPIIRARLADELERARGAPT